MNVRLRLPQIGVFWLSTLLAIASPPFSYPARGTDRTVSTPTDPPPPSPSAPPGPGQAGAPAIEGTTSEDAQDAIEDSTAKPVQQAAATARATQEALKRYTGIVAAGKWRRTISAGYIRFGQAGWPAPKSETVIRKGFHRRMEL